MAKSQLERLHEIARSVQSAIDRPANAPAVTDEIIAKRRHAIVSDRPVLDYALKYGLLFIVQRMIKRKGTAIDTGRQLDMWPQEVRQLVERIADIAVFDPETAEYVDLSPDMSPDQIEDSAKVIMKHGADCMRKGRLMLRLAANVRKLPPRTTS